MLQHSKACNLSRINLHFAPALALQAGLHEVWGGVKPDVARDAHAAAITGTVDGCLEDAGVKPQDLTAVAVTVGPGLSICLQVGTFFF
jgi:N6-L-threonylcarbamoyladenine synthase